MADVPHVASLRTYPLPLSSGILLNQSSLPRWLEKAKSEYMAPLAACGLAMVQSASTSSENLNLVLELAVILKLFSSSISVHQYCNGNGESSLL